MACSQFFITVNVVMVISLEIYPILYCFNPMLITMCSSVLIVLSNCGQWWLNTPLCHSFNITVQSEECFRKHQMHPVDIYFVQEGLFVKHSHHFVNIFPAFTPLWLKLNCHIITITSSGWCCRCLDGFLTYKLSNLLIVWSLMNTSSARSFLRQ